MEYLFGIICRDDLMLIDGLFEVLGSFDDGLELISELSKLLSVALERSGKVPVAPMKGDLPGDVVVAASFVDESLKVTRLGGGFQESVVQGISPGGGDWMGSRGCDARCRLGSVRERSFWGGQKKLASAGGGDRGVRTWFRCSRFAFRRL